MDATMIIPAHYTMTDAEIADVARADYCGAGQACRFLLGEDIFGMDACNRDLYIAEAWQAVQAWRTGGREWHARQEAARLEREARYAAEAAAKAARRAKRTRR